MEWENKISAKIIKDSISERGKRITTFELVFPRYILPELNTHRLFSKNSASSRAIPFDKMVKSVKEDPFIPIAWQKYHPGMQGTEYLDDSKEYELHSFLAALQDTLLNRKDLSEDVYKKLQKKLVEKTKIIHEFLLPYVGQKRTLSGWWLLARDKAVEAASILYVFDVTKQLCNRLLEPFMYHKVLLTATEFENFFRLRCPSYQSPVDKDYLHKSKKELLDNHSNPDNLKKFNEFSVTDWLEINKGQAEIHIADLAEKMYDAMQESTPDLLREGEWHLPYSDDLPEDMPTEEKLKICTARCARLSYQTLGDNPTIDFTKDINLYTMLLEEGHMSPFEHCAEAMDEETYFNSSISEYIRGETIVIFGVSRNFRGFLQYRSLIENS